MIILRELVYEDKKSISEFGINDVSSLNYLIYEEWLLNLPDLKPFKPGLSQRRLRKLIERVIFLMMKCLFVSTLKYRILCNKV